ncbi:MAG TPA: LCP family protein [Patescibacteria group bacterium]
MKLKYLRPTRIFIATLSFIQRHVILLFFLLVLGLAAFAASKGLAVLKRQNIKPQDLLSFFGSPKEKLDSTNDVTNFLLLGIRGEGTDSPDLADTIIIASYNHDTNVTTLVSIPRDLWVPSLQAKINAAYYYGLQATPSAGFKMAQAAILEDTGLPIHYTAVVNFAMFQDIVDLLGGVDVQNDVAFTDTEFPIPGKENAQPLSARYETISFPAGPIHMDGATALKFVRSRHSEGEEGTDFARARRQRAVIDAIRVKVLNPNFLLDEKKVASLQDIVNKNLNTNIPSSLYPAIAKLALDTKDKPINSFGLSDRPDDKGVTILFNPPVRNYAGAYVLIAKDNNWEALKKYIQNKITGVQ